MLRQDDWDDLASGYLYRDVTSTLQSFAPVSLAGTACSLDELDTSMTMPVPETAMCAQYYPLRAARSEVVLRNRSDGATGTD